MPIYKNNVKYDFGYQIEDSQCLPYPDTIDNFAKRVNYIDMDNSWLPYMQPVQGQIIFDDEVNRIVRNTWLTPEEYPVKINYRFTGGWNINQIYINNNNTLWGSFGYTWTAGTGFNDGGENHYITFIDELRQSNAGDYDLYHTTSASTLLSWIPNSEVHYFCHYTADNPGYERAAIINALDITDYAGNSQYPGRIYEKIYLNEELHETMRNKWGQEYESHVIDYTAAETQWLDDYFAIKENGSTMCWYEDTLKTVFGKYIQLYKNGTLVGEEPYWMDDYVKTNIGVNLTNSSVVKTGSITIGQLTKNYSITQTAFERTLKFRFNIDVFEDDGWTFDRFSIWPFLAWNWGGDSIGQLYYNERPKFNLSLDMIKLIKYKKASDSNWTVWQKPTSQELLDLANSLTHDPNGTSLSSLFTIQIPESGVYDIEIGYIDTLEVRNAGIDTRPMLFDGMWAYKTNEGIRSIVNHHLDNQQDGANPWLLALDMGDQYAQYVWGDAGIRVKEWNGDVWVDSFSCSNIDKIYDYMGGLRDCNALYKNVSYTNVYRNGGHYDWVNQCTDSLFYNIPERQKGGSWFLSTGGNFTKLYLHPDIYALPNYGFDGTAEEWNNDVLQSFYDRGGQIYELPQNWKTLIPNYIGI